MADWTKPYPPDFRSGGDLTNQVFAKMIPNETDVYTKLTALRNRQRAATPPANPNTGDIWECSATGGGYTADVVYRYSGSAWVEATAASLNVPNRNTVLQGKVSSAGALELFTGASAALTVQLNATTTPAIFSFMNGNNASQGAVDIIDSVASDDATFWSSLPTSSTVYLYVNHSSGTLTGGFTTVAPVYQNHAPAHVSGKHWIDFNTGLVQSSNGSTWTAQQRVFVGTATTDGTKVTATTIEPYNITRADIVGNGYNAGDVIFTAKNTAPIGFLKANGAAISRTTYASLFSAIGTVFGVGDNSTTFNLPDLRGEFIRGWDDARGIDASRLFGSLQLDSMQGHHHIVGAAKEADSAFEQTLGQAPPQYIKSVNATTIITDGTNGTPRVAAETRPRNIALLACIKY